MDTEKFIVALDDASNCTVRDIGSKAHNLCVVRREGFKVPDGFSIKSSAYSYFLKKNRLDSYIDWEMTRKPFDEIRWEEIWDASLRIRLSFLKGKFPKDLEAEIKQELSKFYKDTVFSVRSSSPDEDSREYSFAGIHESFVNVVGESEVLEKIKLVWASLWSDRSLLYKKEHKLDSLNSTMSVLVQVMAPVTVSGLLFTQNPSKEKNDEIVIEAIDGSLNLLVDNKKSPDRILLDKTTGDIKEYRSETDEKILKKEDIKSLFRDAHILEGVFKTPIDIEWTGTKEDFTVLQVRPITHLKVDENKDRKWYLTLTPKGQTLIDLTDRVEKSLIPALELEGEELSKINPKSLSDSEFIAELKHRGERYKYWLDVYWDDFIPLAHGIRNFGVFYNDLMSPEDPYEFVNLLKTQRLLAYERNNKMKELALELIAFPKLREELIKSLDRGLKRNQLLNYLTSFKEEREVEFIDSFLILLNSQMDVLYDNKKLESAPEVILGVIVRLSEKFEQENTSLDKDRNSNYTDKYFEAAKEQNLSKEAEIWLRVGRVSWKLRDDDNILLGKLENQLLIFIEYGIELLKSKHKKVNVPSKLILTDWESVYNALTTDSDLSIERDESKVQTPRDKSFKSRQLIGQPSSSGIYSGKARIITTLEDFKEVKDGEVLVFDAVQPQMTFIISLAGAIIERRGGMLVHSSIIAREMDIPAVNGVKDATTVIRTGDTVTVNGDLGVVVVGDGSFGFDF